MENNTQGEPGPRHALVFGGSGQIGERLLANLLSEGWQVTAVSRTPRAATAGLEWRQGDLSGVWQGEPRFDAIISCGPLDHFARWYAASQLQAPRVLAFGSTSVEVKHASSEWAERDVARRLREAEELLFSTARQRGVAATVLRPTLVYGAGRDKTLSQIAALASRTGFFVLPTCATGLRQPVHVQDLADAAMQALASSETAGNAYALGGGEVLGYGEMVRRVLAALPRRPRLLHVPTGMFTLALGIAHRLGRLRGMNKAALARMADPLAFDIEPARRDFGYAPRAFIVDAAMVGMSGEQGAGNGETEHP